MCCVQVISLWKVSPPPQEQGLEKKPCPYYNNGFMFVFYGLFAGLCAGQRMVTIQKGHLYRAKGYHITIWCNVSSYEGPLEQTFEWSVYRPSAPTTEMRLVSTSDSNFPYAAYAQRVRAGEIYAERIRGDSVLLHITRLQAEDTGEYECYTPNTDERYYGTYSAKTKLSGKVKNTLPMKIIDIGPP